MLKFAFLGVYGYTPYHHRQCGEAAAVGEVVVEDVACRGHVGVAEPPMREVAVDMWA